MLETTSNYCFRTTLSGIKIDNLVYIRAKPKRFMKISPIVGASIGLFGAFILWFIITHGISR